MMEDMIGTYLCLKTFPWGETFYKEGLKYYVRPGNVALADRMKAWQADGFFEKLNDDWNPVITAEIVKG